MFVLSFLFFFRFLSKSGEKRTLGLLITFPRNFNCLLYFNPHDMFITLSYYKSQLQLKFGFREIYDYSKMSTKVRLFGLTKTQWKKVTELLDPSFGQYLILWVQQKFLTHLLSIKSVPVFDIERKLKIRSLERCILFYARKNELIKSCVNINVSQKAAFGTFKFFWSNSDIHVFWVIFWWWVCLFSDLFKIV